MNQPFLEALWLLFATPDHHLGEVGLPAYISRQPILVDHFISDSLGYRPANLHKPGIGQSQDLLVSPPIPGLDKVDCALY